MNIRSILLVALMLVAKTYYLYAQDQSESPYFFIPNEEADVEAFPLLQTEADVNIVGVIADVRVTQLYQNTGKEAIEAIYVFPASTNAAVYGMQMIIGKRVVYAKIKEKNEAQQIYNKAKEEGKSASLLEQHRPNVFQMSVANIMPGDQVKVELFYTEMLVPQEGIYEFVYPTVVGPRYASKQEEEALTTSRNWNANPYLQEKEAPNYSFDMNVHIRAGIPIRDVACNSHSVKVDFLDKNELKVCLDHSAPQLGNKDFVLQYRLRGEQIENGLLLYEGKEENFFLMMMQPPKRPKVRNIPAREYIFIMDVSGSMNGYPLDVSKKMMGELLGTMQAKDRFNILYFAGGNSFLSETSLPPTQQNIQNALQGLNMQRGSGGTEMMSAVKRAMSVKKREGMSRSLVILTDGYISAEAEVFDYIRNHLDEANFFAFGIGNGVNRHLIEGIAHAGFSDPFVVMEPETAAENANKFKAYIQTPVLTNLSVDFKGMDVYDMTPARLPDLMGERPILLFGKYRGEATDQWTISGENAKGKFSRNISFTSQDTKKENAALQYLWARHRLKTLSDFSNSSRAGEELKYKNDHFNHSYEIFQHALEGYLDSESDKGVMFCSVYLGLVCEALKRPDEAKRYFLNSLKKAKELGHDDFIYEAYANLGNFYSKSDQLDEAIECYNASLHHASRADKAVSQSKNIRQSNVMREIGIA